MKDRETEQLKREIRMLRIENQQLERKVFDLEKQLKRAKSDNNALMNDKKDLQEEIAKLDT